PRAAAGDLRRHVGPRAVLRVGVRAEPPVIVLIAPEHGERPHAGPLVDGHVADDLGGRVDVGAGVDAGPPPRHLADHRPAAAALDEAHRVHRPAAQMAPAERRPSIARRSSPRASSTSSVSSPSRGAALAKRAGARESFTGLPRFLTGPNPG